jgi:periplasmic protein TonB
MASVMAMPGAADSLLPAGREWLGLGGIVALHAVALAGLAIGLQRPEPVTPPAIIGVLVSAPPPSIEPPKPLLVEPEPLPRPVVKPKPVPLPPPPVAPPSERAIAAPPPEPPREAAPPPAAPPAPPVPPAPVAPPAPPAPVTQPRSDAAHLNNPLPVYPVVSRRLGEQGRVLFDVYILPDGSVGEIKVKQSSGFERLDRAALEAVRQWRFVPARRGDTPIAYWYVQPFTWSIDR